MSGASASVAVRARDRQLDATRLMAVRSNLVRGLFQPIRRGNFPVKTLPRFLQNHWKETLSALRYDCAHCNHVIWSTDEGLREILQHTLEHLGDN